MTKIRVNGLDLAKNPFPIHGAGSNGTVILPRKLSRAQGKDAGCGGIGQPHGPSGLGADARRGGGLVELARADGKNSGLQTRTID
ncbi:hypothetical protein KO516_04375 [Citreicella sp. C3M06]|uniref:hypothetical protein n=1 Tax=Citreicella sp. C3M06 TaxID=2841564 RepID=UPI001C088803|nr:hypothetical protein [Citreicella sp. C3M06]MBU2960075.1 hypothetical protein [Citreicella sp. C3M06]